MQTYLICIVDMERFAGLNVCSFNPIEVFTEILLCYLGQKCLLFGITKEGCLYSWEKVHDTLEKHEKHESLAQRIFPHLQYVLLSYVIVCNGVLLNVYVCSIIICDQTYISLSKFIRLKTSFQKDAQCWIQTWDPAFT